MMGSGSIIVEHPYIFNLHNIPLVTISLKEHAAFPFAFPIKRLGRVPAGERTRVPQGKC